MHLLELGLQRERDAAPVLTLFLVRFAPADYDDNDDEEELWRESLAGRWAMPLAPLTLSAAAAAAASAFFLQREVVLVVVILLLAGLLCRLLGLR